MRLPTTLALAAATVLTSAPTAAAHHAPLPPGRDLRTHVVQPGETATGLAVRHHAWTAELVAHNHLGPDAALVAGQRLEIPVVRSALPSGGARRAGSARPRAASGPAPAVDPSRDRVRDRIDRVARRRGVDPELALAVSWQEAGWRMHHVSSAGAIGAMQVLPSTADWMEWYVGRTLRPRRLHDNAVTGVALLRVLADHTATLRRRVGAYYQGLGAVQQHGLYPGTRAYVADVLAIRHRLERGRPPA